VWSRLLSKYTTRRIRQDNQRKSSGLEEITYHYADAPLEERVNRFTQSATCTKKSERGTQSDSTMYSIVIIQRWRSKANSLIKPYSSRTWRLITSFTLRALYIGHGIRTRLPRGPDALKTDRLRLIDRTTRDRARDRRVACHVIVNLVTRCTRFYSLFSQTWITKVWLLNDVDCQPIGERVTRDVEDGGDCSASQLLYPVRVWSRPLTACTTTVKSRQRHHTWCIYMRSHVSTIRSMYRQRFAMIDYELEKV